MFGYKGIENAFYCKVQVFFLIAAQKKSRGIEEQMKNIHIQKNLMSRILQLKGFTGK